MNLYLIGYRGTGKTTLGRALSIQLKMDSVDMDDLLVENLGMTIPDIFKNKGEAFFRNEESRLLKELSVREDLVVSTGGGVIILPENREILRSSGTCVWLQASVEQIYQRIAGDANRPALTEHQSQLEEIRSMLNTREPWYRETAHLVLDTEKMGIQACVESIMKITTRELEQ